MSVTHSANAVAATYVHETMDEEDFYTFVDGWDFTTFGDLIYSHVEYMNSPHGLIVLAHQNTVAGQVDGIHPASLSHSIAGPNNIVEPLVHRGGGTFCRQPVAYNSHWMGRRSQGSLVLAAFGRMVDGGSPEAPCFTATDDEAFTVTVYDGPHGPVVGVFDLCAEVVHVIRPAAHVDARESLLNVIGNTLERIRATPETHIDYLQEAMDLLEQIEAWTKDRHPAGYLIFRDPADAITIQEIA